MSLLPRLTATDANNFLFATTQQFAQLSTSLSTVSISTSTGAGVSVSEPTANNFVFSNALSNSGGIAFVSVPGSSTLGLSNAGVTGLVAGTGVSVSGATGNVTVGNTGVTQLTAGSGIGVSAGTGSITVSNSGVLSVSAGSNVTIGGTASAPVVNANLTLTQSQTNLQPGALPSATAVGANTTTGITFPVLGGSGITVVPGGMYMLQGNYSMTTTAAGYGVTLAIDNAAGDVIITNAVSADYAPGGVYNGKDVPFSALVIATNNQIGMYISNSAAAGGQTTDILLEPCYITRIS